MTWVEILKAQETTKAVKSGSVSGLDLHELRGEAPRDADPVDGGDEAVSGHRAEDERAQLLPLLAEVMWVDLSEEDGQDHGQDRHQVHLPPVLQRQEGQRLNCTICAV